MKKRALKMFFFLLLAIFTVASFPLVASASTDAENSAGGIEDALEDFYDLLPPEAEHLAKEDGAIESLGFEALLSELIAGLKSSGGRVGAFFLLLMGAAMIMASVSAFEGELSYACTSGVCVVCSAAVFSALLPAVRETSESIRELCSFFEGAYPVMLGVTSLGGGASSSAAQSVSMGLTLQICNLLSSELAFLVGAIFVLGAAGALGGSGIGSVSRKISLIFTRGMGIMTAVMGGILSLQTVLTSLSDSAIIRAVKYSASGAIPVVGGAVSGAVSVLGGGLAYAKGIIGGGGVAVIVGVALVPLLTLLLYKLCFGAAETFLDFCAAEVGVKCMGAISSALDALIAVYATSTACFLLQSALFIMGGVSL